MAMLAHFLASACAVLAAVVSVADCSTPISVQTGIQAAVGFVDAGYLSFNIDWWDPVHMANYQRPDYPDGCPRFEEIAVRG